MVDTLKVLASMLARARDDKERLDEAIRVHGEKRNAAGRMRSIVIGRIGALETAIGVIFHGRPLMEMGDGREIEAWKQEELPFP